MARPTGSRNAGYEQERAAILGRLRGTLLGPAGARTSFREMAVAAGVSAATLRHYFGNRQGVLAALLADMHVAGLPFLQNAAAGPIDDGLRASLQWLLMSVVHGWRLGVGAIHVLGLSAGMGDPMLGPAYVQEILEPTLQATEARLARHIAAGHLRPCDVRHAALSLISPLVLGLLHQDDLFGARCRPLDLDRFLQDHLDCFITAHTHGDTTVEKSR